MLMVSLLCRSLHTVPLAAGVPFQKILASVSECVSCLLLRQFQSLDLTPRSAMQFGWSFAHSSRRCRSSCIRCTVPSPSTMHVERGVFSPYCVGLEFTCMCEHPFCGFGCVELVLDNHLLGVKAEFTWLSSLQIPRASSGHLGVCAGQVSPSLDIS